MTEKSKNTLLSILIIGLVSMTVVYALLTTNLRINGTATIAETKWDIHFTNVQDATSGANTLGGTNEGRVTSLGTLDGDATTSAGTGTLLKDVTISLQKPGDFAKVNFDIVNAGTIDAKLAAFMKTFTKKNGSSTTTDNIDGITYTIKCGASRSSGVTPEGEAASQELAKNNGKLECELYVHYDELSTGSQEPSGQKSQTPGQDQTAGQDPREFTLEAVWSYVQK